MDTFFQQYFQGGGDLKGFLNEVERSILVRALSKSNGNQKRAAELLSIKPSTLNAKCKKFGIEIFKEPSDLASYD